METCHRRFGLRGSRRAKFRAAPSTVAKIHELAELGTIDLITNFQLSELKGKDGELEEVILADLDGNKKHINSLMNNKKFKTDIYNKLIFIDEAFVSALQIINIEVL